MGQNVIAAVDDLFFASKIRGTAEQIGVKVRFARSVDTLIEAARAEKPSLVIVDLHSEACNPIELATRLKSDEELRSIQLLGFFSHVQTELQKQAQAAGFDLVIPRSAFAKQLADLLRSR